MENPQKIEIAKANEVATQHVKRALDKFSRIGTIVSAQENQSITYELMEGLFALSAQNANIRHLKVAEG